MAQDKDLVWKKLSDLWQDGSVQTLHTANLRLVIISDTHFGNGSAADDFYKNRTALINALAFYNEGEYSLILLGDIEEFWQFDLPEIVKQYEEASHPKIYPKFKEFGDEHLLRVFGNHDYEWGGLIDPTKNAPDTSSFADEALKLRDIDGVVRILLVHGHQGSIESDKFAWLSRASLCGFTAAWSLVRWTGLFVAGSATKSQVAKDYERTMYGWARQNKVILICGHSHRAIFASRSHAERLQEEIVDLQAENQMRSDAGYPQDQTQGKPAEDRHNAATVRG